jgi:hypothetical protein
MKHRNAFVDDSDSDPDVDDEDCISFIWDEPDSEVRIPREKRVVSQRRAPLMPREAAQVLRSNFRIGQLERQMRIAMNEIVELKEAIAANVARNANIVAASNDANDPRLLDVIGVTNDLFSTNPTVEIEDDPENPGNPMVVFMVSANGSPKELVNLRVQWHKRVYAISSGSSGRFRLAIYPKHEAK